ncbi:MAG: glycosyltransferase [Bacteroidota bacterium]|nr:glycosyltransferase [Bacteroidota bacterium]
MKNIILYNTNKEIFLYQKLYNYAYPVVKSNIVKNKKIIAINKPDSALPEILFLTTFPPRECGIATYSQDLLHAIQDKFGKSFSLKVCALEKKEQNYIYSDEVKYVLQTSELKPYLDLAQKINIDKNLKLVFVQHEFGLFGGEYGDYLLSFLAMVNKPVITTFHTVLPNPNIYRKRVIQDIVALSKSIVVMTKNAANILEIEYEVPAEKIEVIHHGTHLLSSFEHIENTIKNHLGDRLVLSTFGLLSSGKSIETALDALPAIVKEFPNLVYLIIGKTHPEIVKQDGEKYREFLQEKVIQLNLQNHVEFINKYLPLNDLLAYLQRSNIYLFTSKDPHQAVSGTFAYAMSCGCPIISTPIPHASEMLDNGAGIIVDFQNPEQLANATIHLLSNPDLLQQMRLNGLHKIYPTAWQNSAIAHVELIYKYIAVEVPLKYEIPHISLKHIIRMTTNEGMIQFSAISNPDIDTGYTIDDNARALIAVTKHYKLTGDHTNLKLINTYLSFIIFCQQSDGNFLNYVDHEGRYYDKNHDENLEDSNGRTIWALGEFISHRNLFHIDLINKAECALNKSLKHIIGLHSPRAIAFAIKGLYHYNMVKNDDNIKQIIITLANNLVSKYKQVSDGTWKWFEEYLTYANSVLPESLLYAYKSTGNPLYKNIAKQSFHFLLSIIFKNEKIKVVSNQGWHLKGKISHSFGEQPIDVAYTILALSLFYDTLNDRTYLDKMTTAFNWFHGNNHLHQIVYNPSTGGCYDGLEESHINLNQGAESTLSYLLSRLTIDKYFIQSQELAVIMDCEAAQYKLV